MGAFGKAVHVWNKTHNRMPRDGGAWLYDFAMYSVSLKNVFCSSVPLFLDLDALFVFSNGNE